MTTKYYLTKYALSAKPKFGLGIDVVTLGTHPLEIRGKVHERFVSVDAKCQDVVVRDNVGWTYYNHYRIGRDAFPTYNEAVAQLIRLARKKRDALTKQLDAVKAKLDAAEIDLTMHDGDIPPEVVKKSRRKATK